MPNMACDHKSIKWNKKKKPNKGAGSLKFKVNSRRIVAAA